MPIRYQAIDFGQALINEGFPLPEECYNVELRAPADGILRLRYEVNVQTEHLPKLAAALRRIAGEMDK